MDSNKQLATSLIDYCSEAVGKTHTFGRLTSSIYDSAWVAILRKPGTPGLLFPECYKYILDQQHAGSGWEKTPESEIDGIMCTLGGLLALTTNSDIPQDGVSAEDMATRIQHAALFLSSKLQSWDVASCDHVGFEIIIPSMLERLEQKGLTFTFPGQAFLARLNQDKLAKIHPAVWSGKVQTTITHSLEAFLGKADFGGLRDQRVCGGMGSSPSSTAAYLMSSPIWDDEAEEYLRTVLMSRWPGELGSVPGMYPTTGFEVLWIASTLLEDGFSATSFPRYEAVLSIIQEFYDSLGGFASGFSKSSVPDADDTSKAIIIRNLLGVPTNVDKLVETFEGEKHFHTYMMERHPSVTTNCNVLSALLVSPEPAKFIGQIEKCAKYLCASWMQSDVPFQDKWNISEFYPIMLLSQALCRLVNASDKGVINDFSEELLAGDVSLVLFQVLMQTLQKQHENGSWGHVPSKEITAYAIIALGNLASLPFNTQLPDVIRQAIEKGRAFIDSNGVTPDVEYVWIAKTNYSPLNICKAYQLAALETEFPKYSLGSSFSKRLNLPGKEIQKYTHMFSILPILNEFPRWRIEGSVTEAILFRDRLQAAKLDIFDRSHLKGDEYLEFIAMTLACSNNLHGTFLKTEVLFEMMKFILHVYQVDEYYEHVIGLTYDQHLPEIQQLIEKLLEDQPLENDPNSHTGHSANGHNANGHNANGHNANGHNANGHNANGHNANGHNASGHGVNCNDAQLESAPWLEISKNITSFTDTVLEIPAVRRADPVDRDLLKHELRRCLLAHITQLKDSKNHCQSVKDGSEWKPPCGSYHEWARTVGSAHSCSPLSLAFFRCLIPQDLAGRHVTAEEQYIVQDLWVHLANKARMENDRYSVQRDRKESNLNSLDFPEFNRVDAGVSQLTRIIEYEKRSIKLGFEALEDVVGAGQKHTQLEALKFYTFLLELYNNVYALKDISSERKE